jgi:putative Ca2+/H+ antiporter (TMEM165/GDT1 family)
MLATITLATDNGLVGTWLGSTLGMVAADVLAIAAGKALGDRLPEKAIRIGSSIAFLAFAIVMFIDAFK